MTIAETGARQQRPMAARQVIAPALVGRDRELQSLVETLAAAPAVAVIEGEAGIGKTRLVAELAERLRPDGGDRSSASKSCRWLQGGCRKIREPFPLGPVIEAVRGLGTDEQGGNALRAVKLSPVVGALRPLLPELATLLPRMPEPLDDRAAERHRIFRGLAELLAAVGSVDAKHPVVLVLEDLHWADDQTCEFLAYLLADPPQGLSVVLTYRGEEVAPGVRAVTAKLPASVRHAHVTLEPLNTEDTATLALSILDADRLSRRFTDYLWERASGVPFAVEELLALLRERGTLVLRDGRWERRAVAELKVPAGIRDPVLERVAGLSEAGRAVVQAAAVLQEPVPSAVLIATCRADEPTAWRGLEETLASRLLVERGQSLELQSPQPGDPGESVGFRHVLAGQAVYEALSGPHRKDLHRRAASALEALEPLPLGQLAHHLRHANRLPEWAVMAEQAADQAIELGHDDEAVRLLEDVLRHAPLDAIRRGSMAVKLGHAVMEMLRPTDAIVELLSEVREQDIPSVVRAELRFWSALTGLHGEGDWAQRRQLLAEVVPELTAQPKLQAWAMMALGVHVVPDVPRSEHQDWLNRALETLSVVDDPAFGTFIVGKVAMVRVAIGDPTWRQLVERVEQQVGGAPRNRREVNAFESVGAAACRAGHHTAASKLLDAAAAGVGTCENASLELRVRSSLALRDFCTGTWSGLRETTSVLHDELAGSPLSEHIDADVIAGRLALARGDTEQARRQLAEVAPPAEANGDFDMLAFVADGLAHLANTTAESEFCAEVVALAERLLAALERKQLWAPVVRALPGITQLFIAGGRTSEARALVDRCAGELADLDAPLAPAALRYADGALAANDERWPEAADHFLSAAERYEHLTCPYEAAQAREQAAVALSQVGDARAEETMRAALATYRRLGATWDEGRCTRLARRHGIRIPVPHRGGRKGYGQSLSPREKEIAVLAAAGHTNKEIAERLFLSPATVSSHLVRAMNKLGVHTRAALSNAQLSEAARSKNHAITGSRPNAESSG